MTQEIIAAWSYYTTCQYHLYQSEAVNKRTNIQTENPDSRGVGHFVHRT